MNPPESFIPLTAAPVPPAQREFRVTILNGHTHGSGPNANAPASGSGASKPAGFQSLESQRPVAITAGNGLEKRLGEPRVTVQRDGDRVTHLRIQCTCGQIMDLACVYDDTPPPAS
jgi:hypothetical protein